MLEVTARKAENGEIQLVGYKKVLALVAPPQAFRRNGA